MFSKAQLTPEQSRAVRVLEEHFVTWPHSLINRNFDLPFICKKDTFFFTETPLNTSTLPRGENWSWNQSRARQNISAVDSSISACFYKLSTRKTPHSETKAPLFKIWIFNISIPILGKEGDKIINFMWCEKGFDFVESPPTEAQHPIQHVIQQQPIPISRTPRNLHSRTCKFYIVSFWSVN